MYGDIVPGAEVFSATPLPTLLPDEEFEPPIAVRAGEAIAGRITLTHQPSEGGGKLWLRMSPIDGVVSMVNLLTFRFLGMVPQDELDGDDNFVRVGMVQREYSFGDYGNVSLRLVIPKTVTDQAQFLLATYQSLKLELQAVVAVHGSVRVSEVQVKFSLGSRGRDYSAMPSSLSLDPVVTVQYSAEVHRVPCAVSAIAHCIGVSNALFSDELVRVSKVRGSSLAEVCTLGEINSRLMADKARFDGRVWKETSIILNREAFIYDIVDGCWPCGLVLSTWMDYGHLDL